MNMNLCSGCGAYSTYHFSVDGTFVDGQVDRFFGIVFGIAEGKSYYLGISPWQFYIVAEYHEDGDWWETLAFDWSGAVNASYATNTFEVRVAACHPGRHGGYLHLPERQVDLHPVQ